VRVKRLGLPDRFIEHGSSTELRTRCGLDVNGIVAAARELTSIHDAATAFGAMAQNH
jgi:1-deoxy-D-xylulose-5-phosphate synthase